MHSRQRRGALLATMMLTLLGLISPGLVSPAVATAAPARLTAKGPATTTVPTWTAAPHRLGEPYVDKTVRNIIHTSVGGTGAQIRLTNEFGTVPVTFDSVYLGIQADGSSIVAGTNTRATFSGRTSVTIPVGAAVLSDPLPMTIPADTNLAVSVHVLGDTGWVTGHSFAGVTNNYADGDQAADETGVGYTNPIGSHFFVSGLLVKTTSKFGTVVAFGDSITDGVGSSNGTNTRWPDLLSDRLAAAGTPMAVANQGIGGNMVTFDWADWTGVSAQARFDRDVLSQPGVKTVIFMEGINDIGNDVVTDPEVMIAAYRQLISRAHAAGVTIIGATMTPFAGAGYYRPERDAVRIAVNEWIRTSGEFDGVLDFDAALRDPANPLQLNPAYDCGDKLHPNDAGFAVMANMVKLSDLTKRSRR